MSNDPRPTATSRTVWLHAVSLGETHACVPLMQAWIAQDPDVRFLLTHMTATGRAAGSEICARAEFVGRVTQAWLPYDTPGAVRRFLRQHRPSLGVLMETEVWPNLIAGCSTLSVPLALANARLSPRSLRRAQRIRWLIEPALASLAAIVAQTPGDAQRLRSLGVEDALVAGNLKFDRLLDSAQSLRGQHWREALQGRRVILAASTREGEEADLLAAVADDRAGRVGGGPRPLLVMVPRHPQRFDEVADQILARGFRLVRRAHCPALGAMPGVVAGAMPTGEGADWTQTDVLLGDSMGEMAAWYALADVAILGGSLRAFGGQNLIEAAALGCPVVLGEHTFNFAQAADDAVERGAALRAADAGQALALARDICDDPQRRASMSLLALDWVAAHRGAAQRTLRALACLLPDGPVSPGDPSRA